MPDGLYERDALAWSEHQADLLQRLASGERLNAHADWHHVDWPHVIEEVRDVGLSELRACRSLLRQAFVHLLKLHAWPGSRSAPHWRDEVGAFLADAQDRLTRSMRQRIDLTERYARALHLARTATDDAGAPRPLPGLCPWTLEVLLTAQPDVTRLVAMLGNDRV